MIQFKKLQLVKDMFIQVVVCKIKIISKNIIFMIAIDLSKKQALDTGPKAIQQINLTKSLSGANNIFHYLKKRKKLFQIFQNEP